LIVLKLDGEAIIEPKSRRLYFVISATAIDGDVTSFVPAIFVDPYASWPFPIIPPRLENKTTKERQQEQELLQKRDLL
jgi:hypothetical protein